MAAVTSVGGSTAKDDEGSFAYSQQLRDMHLTTPARNGASEVSRRAESPNGDGRGTGDVTMDEDEDGAGEAVTARPSRVLPPSSEGTDGQSTALLAGLRGFRHQTEPPSPDVPFVDAGHRIPPFANHLRSQFSSASTLGRLNGSLMSVEAESPVRTNGKASGLGAVEEGSGVSLGDVPVALGVGVSSPLKAEVGEAKREETPAPADARLAEAPEQALGAGHKRPASVLDDSDDVMGASDAPVVLPVPVAVSPRSTRARRASATPASAAKSTRSTRGGSAKATAGTPSKAAVVPKGRGKAAAAAAAVAVGGGTPAKGKSGSGSPSTEDGAAPVVGAMTRRRAKAAKIEL